MVVHDHDNEHTMTIDVVCKACRQVAAHYEYDSRVDTIAAGLKAVSDRLAVEARGHRCPA
jgi:hypothetical protein